MNSAPMTPTSKKDFMEIFERMIDYAVMYNEDVYTDDMLVDLMADPDKRQEAFDTIIEWMINEDYEWEHIQ